MKRNKILFYFRRPHIPEIKLKQNTETAWNSFSVRTSRNWNKTKLSTVGWNEAPTVGSFVLFLFYFTMCYGHYIPGVICYRLRSYNVVFGCL